MQKKRQPGNPQLLLRVPPNIGPQLQRDARQHQLTVQQVIWSIVAAHYGVEPPPGREPKRSIDRPAQT